MPVFMRSVKTYSYQNIEKYFISVYQWDMMSRVTEIFHLKQAKIQIQPALIYLKKLFSIEMFKACVHMK